QVYLLGKITNFLIIEVNKYSSLSILSPAFSILLTVFLFTLSPDNRTAKGLIITSTLTINGLSLRICSSIIIFPSCLTTRRISLNLTTRLGTEQTTQLLITTSKVLSEKTNFSISISFTVIWVIELGNFSIAFSNI